MKIVNPWESDGVDHYRLHAGNKICNIRKGHYSSIFIAHIHLKYDFGSPNTGHYTYNICPSSTSLQEAKGTVDNWLSSHGYILIDDVKLLNLI